MKNYKIVYGYYSNVIEVEDFEYEQDALDKLIDKLESEGCIGLVMTQEQIDIEGYNEDEYITGGNHCLCLHHAGNFYIEEVL